MTRPAAGPETGGSTGTAPPPLTSLLAHSTTPADLLPHLHQHALDVTGGTRSLLFQHNPRNGALQATSGFGLETLRTDPWLPGPGFRRRQRGRDRHRWHGICRHCWIC